MRRAPVSLLLLGACAHMPSNIVVPDRYLGSDGSSLLVEADSTSRRDYLDLFRSWQKTPPLARVVVADIVGDDRYAMLEFQSLGTPGSDEAFRTILYRKPSPGSEGALDDIYAPGDTALESWRNSEPIPGETAHFLPSNIQWDTTGLRLRASFKDPFHRRWDISFQDPRASVPRAGVLAPVADRIQTPESFPFIFMQDIALVPKDELRSSVKVDGKPLGIATFPVFMDGRICSFLRYTNAVTMFDLMAATAPKSSEPVSVAFRANEDGAIAEAIWSVKPGSRTVAMRFHPALPPLRDPLGKVLVEGRWILGTPAVQAVAAGRFTLLRADGGARLRLTVEEGWSPNGGKAWMKTFQLDAQTRLDDTTRTWRKRWTRTGR